MYWKLEFSQFYKYRNPGAESIHSIHMYLESMDQGGLWWLKSIGGLPSNELYF